ncbi:transcriptional repressor, partial [Stenotrophomonas acidaminiphila]|uniref:transcriptional repressor n=1 Tax=Stenotrophomonas acidaminiphila TaxID=128780 RepID=UPI000AAF0DF3
MESNDLRKVGLKVTHPRMRILALLEQNTPHHHLTAEDIYRQLLDCGDEIGLATVYRVLTQFEAAGLVLKHNFEGGQAVYELPLVQLSEPTRLRRTASADFCL